MAHPKSSKSSLVLDRSLESEAELIESLVRRIRFLSEPEREHLTSAAKSLRKLGQIRDCVVKEEPTEADTEAAAEHLAAILTSS